MTGIIAYSGLLGESRLPGSGLHLCAVCGRECYVREAATTDEKNREVRRDWWVVKRERVLVDRVESEGLDGFEGPLRMLFAGVGPVS